MTPTQLIKNPLDKFQSHSIHYVVLAARSTEALRDFSDTGDSKMRSTLNEIDRCKTLGGEVRPEVFMMMDTRRFSQFTIDNFELDTRIAGFNVPGSKSPNSVALEMNFTVTDSSGISFANFLQHLMDKKLQVSFDGMTILVRVLFVGHKDTGGSELVQSIGIPAFFHTIQVDLNETKGIYHCKCIPVIGVASNSRNNKKWTSVGTASNYFTGVGSNTLGDLVKSLEHNLNRESFRRYKEFNGVSADEKAGLGFGRPLQFLITLPSSWNGYQFSGPTQGNLKEVDFKSLIETEEKKRKNEQQTDAQKRADAAKKAQGAGGNANSPTPPKESFLTINPDLTITEILDVVFSQVQEIRELANFKGAKKDSESIKFYKHLITITSDDKAYTVHVDVVEFTVPNISPSDETKQKIGAKSQYLQFHTDPTTKVTRQIPKNYLEYNYLFSSKNLDVLGLDLKIENLNLMLMQGTKIGQGNLFRQSAVGQKTKDGISVGSDSGSLQGFMPKDPIPMRTLTEEERTNFKNLASSWQNNKEGFDTAQAISQQYTKNISDFYNAGGAAKMTIRGNPELMAKVTLSEIGQHQNIVDEVANDNVVTKTDETVRSSWRTALEKRLLNTEGLEAARDGSIKVLSGQSFVASPVFVKVNVFAPEVDFTTLERIPGSNFSKQLLMDNFYFLSSIKSKIEGSKFTQEMDMLRFSIYGHTELQTNQATEAPK